MVKPLVFDNIVSPPASTLSVSHAPGVQKLMFGDKEPPKVSVTRVFSDPIVDQQDLIINSLSLTLVEDVKSIRKLIPLTFDSIFQYVDLYIREAGRITKQQVSIAKLVVDANVSQVLTSSIDTITPKRSILGSVKVCCLEDADKVVGVISTTITQVQAIVSSIHQYEASINEFIERLATASLVLIACQSDSMDTVLADHLSQQHQQILQLSVQMKLLNKQNAITIQQCNNSVMELSSVHMTASTTVQSIAINRK